MQDDLTRVIWQEGLRLEEPQRKNVCSDEDLCTQDSVGM